MTNEESMARYMAEEFADNIDGLDLTCSLLSAKDKSHAYRLGRYDGFLAGLKVSRSKWYDKAKDLINRLLLTLVLSNTPYERYEEIQKEAEQFLKED